MTKWLLEFLVFSKGESGYLKFPKLKIEEIHLRNKMPGRER